VNANSGKEPDPSDKSGEYTRAGRALQKHGSRDGSAFPKPKGNPSQMNSQGQNALDRIVNSSNSRIESGNRFGGVDVFHESGMGARFDASGTFRGFLEPPR
jgi:filamentous hemagglutinin